MTDAVMDEIERLTPTEIARRVARMADFRLTAGPYRSAEREAAVLVAQRKLTEQSITAMEALNRTGKWVTGVGIALAAIQAWPVLAGWLGVAGK